MIADVNIADFVNDISSTIGEVCPANSIYTDTALVTNKRVQQHGFDIHALREQIVAHLVRWINSMVIELLASRATFDLKPYLIEAKDFDTIIDLTYVGNLTIAEINCDKVREKLTYFCIYKEIIIALKYTNPSHIKESPICQVKINVPKNFNTTSIVTNKQFLQLFEFFRWQVTSVKVKNNKYDDYKTIDISLGIISTT